MSTQSSPERHKTTGLPQSHLGYCHTEENDPGAELLCLGIRNKLKSVSKLLLKKKNKKSTEVKIGNECRQMQT